MKVKIKFTVLFSLLAIAFSDHSQACTGIALKAEDGRMGSQPDELRLCCGPERIQTAVADP